MINNLTTGESPKINLVFVVGPTACGKSDFAVLAAEALESRLGFLPEIINNDSIQFFAGVEIGAAKPEPALLGRVPHHLVGTVEEGATFTAGDFRRHALAIIEAARERGITTLICVGGSGFYVQALEKGMYPVPEVPEAIRLAVASDLERLGAALLHEELARLDPESAQKIKVADHYRITRALEILRTSRLAAESASMTSVSARPAVTSAISEPISELSEHAGASQVPPRTSADLDSSVRALPGAGARHGETLSQMRARFEAEAEEQPFRVFKIGITRTRANLRERVTQRTRRMMDQGLIKEVEQLRARGLSKWAPLQSVGYREVQEFLDGRISRKELEPLIVTSTMQLAKRQMTWFRRDPKTLWFDSEQGFGPALDALVKLFP